MEKGIKRWFAVLLTAFIAAAVCLFLPDSFLWASDGADTAIEVEREMPDDLMEPKQRTQEIIIPANPAAEGSEEIPQEDTREISVNDNEVPLNNSLIDKDNYCTLHFVIMLAAFFVFAFYIKNMKRQQKRILRLREELEKELERRRQ